MKNWNVPELVQILIIHAMEWRTLVFQAHNNFPFSNNRIIEYDPTVQLIQIWSPKSEHSDGMGISLIPLNGQISFYPSSGLLLHHWHSRNISQPDCTLELWNNVVQDQVTYEVFSALLLNLFPLLLNFLFQGLACILLQQNLSFLMPSTELLRLYPRLYYSKPLPWVLEVHHIWKPQVYSPLGPLVSLTVWCLSSSSPIGNSDLFAIIFKRSDLYE